MTYYIKISGIDDKQNISKYIEIENSDSDNFIKPCGDLIIFKEKEEKNIEKKFINEFENTVNKIKQKDKEKKAKKKKK